VAEKKSSHAVAQYGPGDKYEKCSLCTMYQKGQPPHCVAVVDPISPDGWCRYFIENEET